MLEKLNDLGDLFAQFRRARGLHQDDVAKAAGTNRTVITRLETGRKAPNPDVLRAIANFLGIPEETWAPFAQEESYQRQEFETALGELVGRSIGLRSINLQSIRACESTIELLFSRTLTTSQARDTLNSVLVFYAVRRMSPAFFERYFEAAAFQSLDLFKRGVEKFQKDAIRLFSTFGEAYEQMNICASLGALLSPLDPRSLSVYSERTVWDQNQRIVVIPEEKLDFLGYISVDNYKAQRAKRETLAKYLRELAAAVRREGSTALESMTEKRKRKIDSLLKELNSALSHTPLSGLFAPNPAELEAEVNRILRDEKDVEEMASIQRQALSNLSHYLSADYMDVYVATSMRSQSDFVAVNRFVAKLFAHEDVAPLRLRYFNPTQSWIEDRVAKGLVEALMLKRSQITLYMAQKSDSFGKDSEASVALGQGKPVIVYVPKLYLPAADLDSETLVLESENKLREYLLSKGQTPEDLDELGKDALFGAALAMRLKLLDDNLMRELVISHWADFALLDETERIRGAGETSLREQYSLYIERTIAGDVVDLAPNVRVELEKILQAVTYNFEVKRARVFKEVHPLALQVILNTGVLNGILVSRSVDSCAALLRGLLENRLSLELKPDDDNYKLIEMSTGSTIRVISRNALLSNALDAIYHRSEG